MGNTETAATDALRLTHAALLADLRELEEAIRAGATESLTRLRARLGTTHTHVTEHFRFEEQQGYLDTVRKREPRLEHAIQQLAEEHRQLAQSLDTLLEKAQAAASVDEPFRAELREWIERVRQHELRENDLVQDAFNLDLGAED